MLLKCKSYAIVQYPFGPTGTRGTGTCLCWDTVLYAKCNPTLCPAATTQV